jgi:hypothetical protein
MKFMYNPDNFAFLDSLAQRSPNRYCFRLDNKKMTDVLFVAKDKHEYFNVVPKHTVEFRMFKGTLYRHIFFRSFEFVRSLIEFELFVGISDCDKLHKYKGFVVKNKNQFPLLFEFINNFE